MTTRTVAFNGKFLSASMTGVHRVAWELISGVQDLLTESDDASRPDCRMIAPRSARPLAPLTDIPLSTRSLLTWQVWEQFELPLRARSALLVSLCNLSPILHRPAITMIHDAQVFLTPDSYSPAFRSWYQFALPAIGRSARRILTVSDYSRQQLVRFGVAPASRIDVIHNGSDHILLCPPSPDIVPRLGLEPGRYVVALANTQVHKNIATLVTASSLRSMAGVKLVLVGAATGDDFRAAGMTTLDNVVFAGRTSDSELRSLMEHAACLAFPSLTEGFGLPPAEAMRLGCPVAAAPEGALPEVCGDAAVYVPALDPEAWAEALRNFADSESLRSTHAALGRARNGLFQWRSASRQLLDIIRRELETV